MTPVGVDGCPGGWIAAHTEAADCPIVLRTATALEDLLLAIEEDAGEGLSAVAVDMPILLPINGRRRCDEQARQLLGLRRSTLFFAPPRCVLDAQTHTEASDLAEATTGKRISIQTWNLTPKIREVAALRHRWHGVRELCETHPELCFARMAGGEPLAEPKKTAAGQQLRRQLLGKRLGKRRVEAALANVEQQKVKSPLIDKLDALACLCTALHIDAGDMHSLPGKAERGEGRILY